MITIITTDVNLSQEGKKDLILKGNIIMSEDYIQVCVELKPADRKRIVSQSRQDIDLYLQDHVTYNNSTISDVAVKLDLKGTHVFGFKGTSLKAEWKLSSIKFTVNCKKTYNYFILNIPFDYLYLEMKGSDESYSNSEIENNGVKYKIQRVKDSPNCTMFITNADEDNFEKIRVHLAFFFNTPSEILAKAICINGNTHIERFSPRFDSHKDMLFQPELSYLDIYTNKIECNTFLNFIKHSAWNDLDENTKKNLKQAVYTYVKSKSCDDSMLFLIIYSILDRLAGNKMKYMKQDNNKKRSPYFIMHLGLDEYNIDVRKIGNGTDSRIINLDLVLERDGSKDRNVQNFCDLRDYILHFMTTPQIDEFLSSSELTSAMRFAASIIILNKFGFQCSFRSGWTHLSILKAK